MPGRERQPDYAREPTPAEIYVLSMNRRDAETALHHPLRAVERRRSEAKCLVK
jgi:hypothetical protein